MIFSFYGLLKQLLSEINHTYGSVYFIADISQREGSNEKNVE